jgi:hypothetical protein
MRESRAFNELEDAVLTDNAIPASPHLCANRIPKTISERINEIEAGDSMNEPVRRYAQLVRASVTDMRIVDMQGALNLKPRQAHNILRQYCEEIKEADASILWCMLQLFEKGKQLELYGSFQDNRYVNGDFTDQSNLSIKPFTSIDSFNNVFTLVAFSSKYLFNRLELNSGRISRYMKRRCCEHFSQVAIRAYERFGDKVSVELELINMLERMKQKETDK